MFPSIEKARARRRPRCCRGLLLAASRGVRPASGAGLREGPRGRVPSRTATPSRSGAHAVRRVPRPPAALTAPLAAAVHAASASQTASPLPSPAPAARLGRTPSRASPLLRPPSRSGTLRVRARSIRGNECVGRSIPCEAFLGPRRLPGGGDGARAGDPGADPIADPAPSPPPAPRPSRPRLRRRNPRRLPGAERLLGEPRQPDVLQPRDLGDRQLPRRSPATTGRPRTGLPRRAARVGDLAPGDRRPLRPRRLLPLLRRTRASTSRRVSSRSPQLPADLLVKVGRMRGRSSARSTRSTSTCCPGRTSRCRWSTSSAARRAGSATGVSVARLIPLPGDTFSEVTLQVFRGEAEGLFDAPRAAHDSPRTRHYRVYRDLGRRQQPRPRLVLRLRLQRHRRTRRDDAAWRTSTWSTAGSRCQGRPTGPLIAARRALPQPRAQQVGRRQTATRLVRVRRLPARRALVRGRARTRRPTTRDDDALRDTRRGRHR